MLGAFCSSLSWSLAIRCPVRVIDPRDPRPAVSSIRVIRGLPYHRSA
jgi:hypothetical protein